MAVTRILTLRNISKIVSQTIKSRNSWNFEYLVQHQTLLQEYCHRSPVDYHQYMAFNKCLVYEDTYLKSYVRSWQKDQSTDIHGHNGRDCLTLLLEGVLDEHVYDTKRQLLFTEMLQPSYVSLKNTSNILHRLSCPKVAVSFHIYPKHHQKGN